MGIGLFVLVIFWFEIFGSFLANHTYYASMFGNFDNWLLLIWALVFSAIPMGYLWKTESFSLKTFALCIALAVLGFGVAHVAIKDDIIWPSGFVMLLINISLLLWLTAYFGVGMASLGGWLLQKVIGIKEHRWQEMLLGFGLGVAVLMFLVHILVILKIFYPIIIWIIFLWLGYISYRQKDGILATYKEHITTIFNGVIGKPTTIIGWIFFVLIAVSIIYYLYWFQLAFIPYPTAWDANHAYMYFPKVWAENHGALGLWNPGGVGWYLRYSYIAFWFSLMQPLKWWFWLAADTIAVHMNFLSWLFVLFFWLGLIKEVITYLRAKINDSISLALWWGTLLLWLTSGMGAFLVFVDNKTDLGIMAMTILAMLSGILFMHYMRDHNHTTKLSIQTIKFLCISGFLFGIAVIAKPTAFIDVMVFMLLLIGLWFNVVAAWWMWLFFIGILSYLKILSAPEFIGSHQWVWLMVLWAIGMITWFAYYLYTYFKKQWMSFKNYIHALSLWIFSIVVVIVIGKMYTLSRIIQTDNLGPWDIIKGVLMGYNNDKDNSVNITKYTLLASNETLQVLMATDNPTTITNKGFCSLESLGITNDELYNSLEKAPAGFNEDFGRYIWFGRRTFQKQWGGLWYYLLRLFTPKNNTCYGSKDAVLLCQNPWLIDRFDVDGLQWLLAQMPQDSQGYAILSGALYSDKLKTLLAAGTAINPTDVRSDIVALRQYYQSRTIYTEEGKVSVPFRYLVPFNVVFNRSLQNLSSYYTDIGFVWLFVFIFLGLGLIYTLIRQQWKLFALGLATTLGRAIWWIIGSGIVWYGVGLITWSLLFVSIFVAELLEEKDDERTHYMWYSVVGLLIVWMVIQWFMNIIRIGSQGAQWPFVWYKQSTGRTPTYSAMLQQELTDKTPYTWKDVFDLQFPHYNRIINATKDRANEDGVHIEWTYLQYFLDNQYNVGGFDLSYNLSDWDTCKSYLRIKDNNKKYIVIDPNILSVVMGEGNESLLWRFFGKRNSQWKFEQYGTVSMLVKLWQEWYIQLFGTNNLGAKYAFLYDDATLTQAFGTTDPDELLMIRSKLPVARFFPEDANRLIGFVGSILNQRMMNGDAISDIADIYGKEIRTTTVLQTAMQVIGANSNPTTLQNAISLLTQDERLVLIQYVSLYNLMRQDQAQYTQAINDLLAQSIGGSSQLIIFEVSK